MSDDTPITEARQRSVRVEQDGRDVLLLEFGAARERIEWLQARNEQVKSEAVEVIAQAQRDSAQAQEFVNRVASQLVAWRMTALVALGLVAIMGLLVYASL